MRVYWCDLSPLLVQPAPFLRWCGASGVSLEPYLRLDDALRHLAGRRLLQLALARERPGVHTNVSHSGALVLCACGETPLGIDGEEIDWSAPPPEALLTAGERSWARAQEQPVRAFYRLWTRKESLIKAERRPLADLLVLPELVEDGRLRSRIGGLRLAELPLLPERYAVSVSAREIGPVDLIPVAPDRLFP